VKVDGIMGTKSMAALEAMKQTQISLGFTDKDVDGIRGINHCCN
jgi:lysozyme family protein